MSEFKGTKGNWKLVNNDYGYYTSVRNLDDTRKVCVSRVNNAIESNANMILISKAPEMLEMLQWFVDNFEGVFHEETETDNKVNEAKQLIKQATEL